MDRPRPWNIKQRYPHGRSVFKMIKRCGRPSFRVQSRASVMRRQSRPSTSGLAFRLSARTSLYAHMINVPVYTSLCILLLSLFVDLGPETDRVSEGALGNYTLTVFGVFAQDTRSESQR